MVAVAVPSIVMGVVGICSFGITRVATFSIWMSAELMVGQKDSSLQQLFPLHWFWFPWQHWF
jgi:hypothetical protein